MSRSRTITNVGVTLPWRSFDGSYYRSGTETMTNSSTCVDDIHPDFVRGLRSGDVGGTLDVTSRKYSAQPANIQHYMDRGRYEISSLVPYYLLYNNISYPSFGSAGELDLLSMGATAISRTLPTAPSFSLFNSVGELMNDGLPALPAHTLWKERTKLARSTGSEYLNTEFGWAPLVNDVQNFANTVRKSAKIIRQYHKGSDTKIRRRYSFNPAEFSDFKQSGTLGTGAMVMYPGVDAYNGFGWGTISLTASHKTWFSGAFRYHVPVPVTTMDKLAAWEADANKLIGTRPTPSALWELAPWSWAIDWFSNTGDILKNITALGSDGLVLEYGYIMDEFKQVQVNQATVLGLDCSLTITDKRLKRRVATPYGFGFDMTKLSPRQDAVLVALGLSHGRR